MKGHRTMRRAVILILFVLLSTLRVFAEEKKAKQSPLWKAGVATAVITPEQEIWMAGYGGRKKPSEGIVQQLYAKAIALEDQSAVRFVFVTMDLISVLRELRDSVAREVEEKFRLPPTHLLLNASHTHCGPEYRPRTGNTAESLPEGNGAVPQRL
jgi:neutral ceramidase